ncbi:MAG: hypothetical protein R3277_05165 [Brumimicrobium sp.]|nr:hypothetical protein [Brumimicrobium sp.]
MRSGLTDLKNFRMLFTAGFIFSLICLNVVYGQRNVSDEVIGTPYVGVQYGANLTGGDLADRYGFTNSLGALAGYKTKRNWLFAADGNFLFGNDIRIEGVLQNLKDSQGNISNTSGGPAIVLLFNRGFHINGIVGKLIPVLSPNPNSGIMLQVGAGYSWHKLRVESQEDDVPQIQGDYLKGYDRLTIGANTSQFIGYSFMANRGILNFYGGLYFQQAFTRNQRDIFYDHPNETVSKDLRTEFLYGIRVGWMIPIYKRKPKEFYFN